MKNAVVTGAGGGIGQATVKCFAQSGINVWACMRTQNRETEAVFSALAQKFGV